MMLTLFSAAAAVIFDFTAAVLAENQNELVNIAMYAVVSLYLIARNFCFYFGMVFIDYFSHGSTHRTTKFLQAVRIFLGVYTLSVILNIPLGYYFTISPQNEFTRESLYFYQLLLCFIPMLIAIIDVITAPKRFKKTQGLFMVVFIIIVALGASLDLVLGTTNYIWSCVTAAILFIYFFIIKSNSKIDRLTGIGNRYSFNQFIDKLSRQTSQENYTIAIINIDRIREINSALGHKEGDNAIHDMATIIKGIIRHSDIAARYSGDDFVVVTSTKDNIQRLIDRLEDAIASQNKLRVRPYQLNISFGYDIFTTNSGKSIMDFLEHIEQLMLKCKEARQNEFYTALTARTPIKD
jgi:diguanylate cyclase (GGDEF)-like protein